MRSAARGSESHLQRIATPRAAVARVIDKRHLLLRSEHIKHMQTNLSSKVFSATNPLRAGVNCRSRTLFLAKKSRGVWGHVDMALLLQTQRVISNKAFGTTASAMYTHT
eukprot:5984829-Amphidinium_carterae.1